MLYHTIEDRKREGNLAFTRGDFTEAEVIYTACIASDATKHVRLCCTAPCYTILYYAILYCDMI